MEHSRQTSAIQSLPEINEEQMERRSKLHTLFHDDPKSANVIRKIGSEEEIHPLSVDQAFNVDAIQYDFRYYLRDNRKHVNALSVVRRAIVGLFHSLRKILRYQKLKNEWK